MATSKKTAPLEPPSVLTDRIVRCIGIWETNREGDFPDPKESELDTVAGVHASMATIEQATMPYAVDSILKYKELRSKSTPALTELELHGAAACCKSTSDLLVLVDKAVLAKITPKAFIAANGAAIKQTYLADGDIDTMFAAVGLKAELTELRAHVKRKEISLNQAVKKIKPADALGLGPGSLKSYIRTARKWGENKAGWQRKAVDAMPAKLGSRINDVSISSKGTALANPVIAERVRKELAAKPKATVKQVVEDVATQNNPGEANYGLHVFEIYDRLFKTANTTEFSKVLFTEGSTIDSLLRRIAGAFSEPEAELMIEILQSRLAGK